MFFSLRDNLHHCTVSGRTIILDLEADRYHALPPGMDAAFSRVVAGELCDADDALMLQDLLQHGMLIRQAHAPRVSVRPGIVPALRDLAACWPGRPRPSTIMQVAVAQCTAAWRLRFTGLPTILRSLQCRKTMVADCDGGGRDHAYAGLAAAFEALSPLFRRSERCLVRSLAYHALCSRRGLAAQLVFGVQASPFSAHCWVQQGDLVLNDSIDNVRPFTPIMVL